MKINEVNRIMNKFINVLANIMPHENTHPQTHNYLCVLVLLPNGKKQWYRIGRKMFKAIKTHYNTSHHFPYDILIGSYIVVPLTPYFSNNNAGMGVGKIIYIHYKSMVNTVLCARSQFISEDKLINDFHNSVKFMQHDYNKYSKLQILINLINWKNKATRLDHEVIRSSKKAN